jgi:hypothetical protein
LRPNVGRFFLRFIVDAAMATADNGSDEGAIVTPAVAVAVAAAGAGAEAAVEVELEGVPVDGAALPTLCCASAFGSCLCSCVSDEALVAALDRKYRKAKKPEPSGHSVMKSLSSPVRGVANSIRNSFLGGYVRVPSRHSPLSVHAP